MTDLTDAQIETAAREIADQIIDAARNSGSDPIAWVTSNAMMPPLRWYSAAEAIWQEDDTGEAFEYLGETVERYLSDASVALECPDYDNALYAVDLARFEYSKSEDSETLQDEWRPIEQ